MEAAESAQILEGMVAHQREKLLKVARELVPDATPEDLRNPQDFSELLNDPLFNYEDGLLTGLLSAQAALRISNS
ncbi:MAG: hypothetical protein VX610_03385 [SAR324 cluster bacterium]|nr:hypothetical protein [SAR324 cluster bacterium]